MNRALVMLFTCVVAAALDGHTDVVAQTAVRYLVSITNMTRAQSFTPILVATHTRTVRVFAAGTAASPELREVAEEGNIAPLMMLLRGLPLEVRDVTATTALLTPGVTVSVEVMAAGPFDRLSLVSMLIPTNDAFIGLNGIVLPGSGDGLTLDLPAYDAGTERNDERCASIPGPGFSECNGPGGGARIGGGEGAVTIHNGIRGAGDMRAADRDWKNPVARVTIRLVP